MCCPNKLFFIFLNIGWVCIHQSWFFLLTFYFDICPLYHIVCTPHSTLRCPYIPSSFFKLLRTQQWQLCLMRYLFLFVRLEKGSIWNFYYFCFIFLFYIFLKLFIVLLAPYSIHYGYRQCNPSSIHNV